jgi:RHS repeat-associated protein
MDGNNHITSPDHWQTFTDLDSLGNWRGFHYDDDGSTWTRYYSAANEVTSTGWEFIDPTHDLAGNMTFDGTFKYTYDAWNRLMTVRNYSNNLKGTYSYDGLGRRVKKALGSSGSPYYDYYYNEAWQILEVRKNGSANPYEQYVWYIDSPVCRFRDGNTDGAYTGGSDDNLHFINDANFNVTALVNTSGTVVERYVYDAYGAIAPYGGSPGIYSDDWNTQVTWTSSKTNEILFCGYRYDPESNLYHVRHRMYQSTIGQWCERDPIGYADSTNLYLYAGSHPVEGWDSTGLIMVVEDFGPYQALEHWAGGTGEAVTIIGDDFINAAKNNDVVQWQIDNLTNTMLSRMRNAKCGETVIQKITPVPAPSIAQNQPATMHGWLFYSVGTMYHDYAGSCTGTKVCHTTPVNGCCDEIVYQCSFNIEGYIRYSYGNVNVGGKAILYIIAQWIHINFDPRGNHPKDYDVDWRFQDSRGGSLCTRRCK